MIGEICTIFALTASFIASYFDIKTREIAKLITLPMIFIGLVVFFAKYYGEWYFFIPLAISYFFIWLLWRLGIIGGGDTKLIMGIIALVSPFYGIFFIPLFFVILGFISFIHYFIFGLINEIEDGNAKMFAAIISLIIVITVATYFIANFFSPTIAKFAALLTFIIAADIASSFLPCKKKAMLSEDLIGEPLAETIYLQNGKVMKKEENASFIISAIRRKEIEGEIIAKPSYSGLTKKEIEILRKYCNEILIFITYPMAPIIFLALLISILISFFK